jgi:hypothetical protein
MKPAWLSASSVLRVTFALIARVIQRVSSGIARRLRAYWSHSPSSTDRSVWVSLEKFGSSSSSV